MKKPVRSRKLFAQARQILPGGVDSPVRAFQSVGGIPLFVTRASGATIEDVDGNRFIDYVMSWGPLIHGHAPAGLVKAIAKAARLGTSFGAPSPLEHELGEQVRALVPVDGARALRQLRHRGGDERGARRPRVHRRATRSSSSPAAITVTPTRFW